MVKTMEASQSFSSQVVNLIAAGTASRDLEVEQEVEKEDRSVQLREDRKDKNKDLAELQEEDKENKVIKDKEENNF